MNVGLLLCLLLLSAASAADTTVRVVVTNVVKADGVLLAGVYASEDAWLGATTVARLEVPVADNLSNGTLTFELSLPPGRYGLSVLQDLNGNRKLDTNIIGIPKEPSGSSNDAPARFGPPEFGDALFTVADTPLELRIRLN